MSLTDRTITNLKPASKPYKRFDGGGLVYPRFSHRREIVANGIPFQQQTQNVEFWRTPDGQPQNGPRKPRRCQNAFGKGH